MRDRRVGWKCGVRIGSVHDQKRQKQKTLWRILAEMRKKTDGCR